MQRYRVNYPLLGGLVAGTLILGVASYFLWDYQVDRNATDLLKYAEENEAAGKLIDARRNLEQYTRLRRNDDEARIKLAHLSYDLAMSDEGRPEDTMIAHGRLVLAARESDDPTLHRKLIKMHRRIGRTNEALAVTEELLEENPKDEELQITKARCLYGLKKYREFLRHAYEMIGYDRGEDIFDSEKAVVPGAVGLYSLLSSHLSSVEDDEELSRRVITQMVEANPENYEAHLMSYRVLSRERALKKVESKRELATLRRVVSTSPTSAGKERAQQELDARQEEFEGEIAELDKLAAGELQRAAELDPTAESVLLATGQDFLRQEEYEKAYEAFELGRKEYPSKPLFIYQLAQALVNQGQRDQALTLLEEGIADFGIERGFDLAQMQIELRLTDREFKQVQEYISDMRQSPQPRLAPLADFYEAKVLQAQGKYLEAARKYEAVRPLLKGLSNFQPRAGIQQVACFERLGQWDLARDLLQRLRVAYPDAEVIAKALRKVDEKIGADNQFLPIERLNQMVDVQLALPEAQQDWPAVSTFIKEKLLEGDAQDDTRRYLLEARVLVKRKKWKEAADLIREADRANRDNVSVSYEVARMLATMPGKGPALALKKLDQIVEKYGDSPRARVMRVAFLANLYKPGDDKTIERIAAAGEGMEEFKDRDQSVVWKNISNYFRKLRMYDKSTQAMLKSVELEPEVVTLYLDLFAIALEEQDDTKMLNAQAKLLEFVGDKTSAEYMLMEAQRIIAGVANQRLDPSELERADRLIDQTISKRDKWNRPHIVAGRLDILKNQNYDAALKHFEEAASLGRTETNVLVVQIKLLAKQGRFSEARERLELIPHGRRAELLGQTYAEILKNSGDPGGAFVAAQQIAEASPQNVFVQLWFSEMAFDLGRKELAKTAVDRAVDLQSSDPSAWMRMVSMYKRLKLVNEVQGTLRKAQLSLDARFIPDITAKYYEMVGRWQTALRIYRAIAGEHLDSTQGARGMAEFYLRWVEADAENEERAKVEINKILRAAHAGDIAYDSPNAIWALTNATKLLAKSGRYPDSVKAEKLLSHAYESSNNSEAMAGLLADVLSSRNDPSSWLRATKLFEGLEKRNGLTKSGQARLGRLLYRVGDWEQCKNHMEKLVSRYPADVQLRISYVKMLIKNREFDEAEKWLAGVSNVSQDKLLEVELRARLAAAQDDMAEVRRLLKAVTPRANKLTNKTLSQLIKLASVAVRASDYEYAEVLLGNYVRHRQEPEAVMQLAMLRALHLDAEAGLAQLQPFFEHRMDDVLTSAVQILRARRREVGSALDEPVEKMLAKALRDDPESVRRLTAQAEVYEIQGEYEKAIVAYNLVLERDDVPLVTRASAMNNLAYVYALGGQQTDKALELVNQAIDRIGPLADVLDTRGVIYIASQQGDEAVADLEMAVLLGETANKYFHLAQSYLLTGQSAKAIEAWDKAVEMGLDADAISSLEQAGYRDSAARIEQLRTAEESL